MPFSHSLVDAEKKCAIALAGQSQTTGRAGGEVRVATLDELRRELSRRGWNEAYARSKTALQELIWCGCHPSASAER
jgi:hypothetical protein